VVHADVDSVTYDTVAQCGPNPNPKFDFLLTHTRYSWQFNAWWWSEPLDLPFFLPHTNFIWSLAALNADVDSATHDTVAQCGPNPNPNPKLDLMRTHTRYSWRFYARLWSEPLDLPFLLSQTNVFWSLAPVDADVDIATYDMLAQFLRTGEMKRRYEIYRNNKNFWSLLLPRRSAGQ